MGFYFAIDIGTTNIEVSLLNDKETICRQAFSNRQSLYGSDVLTRINTITRDREYLNVMSCIVKQDIFDCIINMTKEKGITLRNISRICITGNTTMISILLKYDVVPMGTYPFTPTYKDSIVTSFYDVFGIEEEITVIISGTVSAFVGGDILSGIYYLSKNSDMCFNNKDISLFIDMGTNGEIVLNNKGSLWAISTACGPAFEGCTRKQQVYGYSVIDGISMGINSGKIKRSGVFVDEYIETGINISNIHIDNYILQQILMAKSAIYTGIVALLKHNNLTVENVDRVYVAGGFGFHLKPASAVNIGLFPESFQNIIYSLGNTSLEGACLLVRDFKNQPLDIDKYNINVLELTFDEYFKDNLIENMTFNKK